MRKTIVVLVLFSLNCAFSPAAWSQNAISNGSISGRVNDNSGAVVSGADVNLKNADTGVQQSAKTNGLGLYNFPSLRVGTYTVSVRQTGFRTTEVASVAVQAGTHTAVY